MGGDSYWAVRHTGGCSGKLHGYTLTAHEALAERVLERCEDPACQVVRVHIEEVDDNMYQRYITRGGV